jgi:phosphopantothenoylcysteine decarboxylase/phosphopantothenate--cysteine ligase
LVCPKTFEALSGNPVSTELFAVEQIHSHISLGHGADLLCVAPTSANFLAKAATGIADDLLSTAYLSFVGPVVFAPAMNTTMWEKAAVQRNVRQLIKDGVHFIGPETGRLSCGDVGLGRMSEPEEIFKQVIHFLEQEAS